MADIKQSIDVSLNDDQQVSLNDDQQNKLDNKDQPPINKDQPSIPKSILEIRKCNAVNTYSFNIQDYLVVFWWDGQDPDTARLKAQYRMFGEQKHGSSKSYFRSGRCYQLCNYHYNQLSGKCYTFDDNGTLVVEDEYDNGQLV